MSNIPLYQRVTHLLLQSIYKDRWPSSKPILYTFPLPGDREDVAADFEQVFRNYWPQ